MAHDEQRAVAALAARLEAERTDFSRAAVKEAAAAADAAMGTPGHAAAALAHAVLLSASPLPEEVELAADLLEDLTTQASVQQDAMFRCAVAAWRLRRGAEVRRWLWELLRLNPQHADGAAFVKVYEADVWRQGAIGFGIAAAVLLAAGAAAWYFSRPKAAPQGKPGARAAPYLTGGFYYNPRR